MTAADRTATSYIDTFRTGITNRCEITAVDGDGRCSSTFDCVSAGRFDRTVCYYERTFLYIDSLACGTAADLTILQIRVIGNRERSTRCINRDQVSEISTQQVSVQIQRTSCVLRRIG